MTQSTWAAIVARVVSQMQAIPNIGQVHNRTRITTDENGFVAIAASEIGGESRARMWMCHLEVPARESWADQGGNSQWDRTIVIEGFVQMEDANSSELTAIDLGEKVIRQLNTDVRTTKLGGTLLGGAAPATFVGRPAEPRLFVFVICHYLRIELPVFSIDSL